jgi:phosphatidate cytidylyltransferase
VSEPVFEQFSIPIRELIVRVLSAIVLGLATVLAAWSGPVAFAVLVAGVSAVLIWEWGRLMRGTGLDMLAAVGWLSVLAAVGLVVAGLPLVALMALALGGLATLLLGRADDGPLEAAGVLYVGLPSVALVWLRGSPELGWQAVLLVLLIVWATDTGAFVSGRYFGGPKLWASISPNKTWAGLIGGVLAAAGAAWLNAAWVGSGAPVRVVALAMVLAVISQLGDLTESALKRAHGVKDTSRLIPGHGGFMDRVDGLIFAAVAAALYAACANHANPGAALLGLR